jgi:riboflavin synthase
MFTGIVEEVGTVETIRLGHQEGSMSIRAGVCAEGVGLGDSIAVNGVCLTITHLQDKVFSFDFMPETFRRTNLGLLTVGSPVNLERALRAGQEIGGHFVQGHVDGVGELLSVTPDGSALIHRYGALPNVMRYCVTKGFIAVDGVSLTVVDVDDVSFTVSLVTYTLEHTVMGKTRPGYKANLEADILAKYVAKALGKEGI